MHISPIVFTLLTTLIGFRDNDPVVPSSGGISYMSHIELSVDSACAQVPNVLTPNGDGINDIFIVLAKNMASLQTTIHSSNNSVVFSSNALWPSWVPDSTELGRYRVVVTGTSLAGVPLSGWSYLDVLVYTGTNTCLPFNGIPVTPDQFDPRICGVTYASNDNFCP